MSEIQWINGKQEYSREEVKAMLQTQRAMIHNDLKHILISQAEKEGLKGQLTKQGNEVVEYLKNCRQVEF